MCSIAFDRYPFGQFIGALSQSYAQNNLQWFQDMYHNYGYQGYADGSGADFSTFFNSMGTQFDISDALV